MNIPVSTKISALLLLILVMIPINYYFVVRSMQVLENDAFAINHIGLLRGSIQRIVKNEGNGGDNEATKRLIEKTFAQIDRKYIRLPENAPYLRHTSLTEDYEELRQCWKEIAQLIDRPDQKERMLEISELCWNYADTTAFKAQTIAETKRQEMMHGFFIRVAAAFTLILSIISYVIVKVRQGLEKDLRLDPLTQVFNRTYFIERLDYHIAATRRNGRPLSLLFVDVDHFKQINDTLGHQTGDALLQQFANRLKHALRASDIVFRFGGEEFVIIAPDCDIDCASRFAEKLRTHIEATDFRIGRELTVSIGAAQLQHDEHAGDLIRRSDDAMYRAKKEGRNRVVIS